MGGQEEQQEDEQEEEQQEDEEKKREIRKSNNPNLKGGDQVSMKILGRLTPNPPGGLGFGTWAGSFLKHEACHAPCLLHIWYCQDGLVRHMLKPPFSQRAAKSQRTWQGR